MAFWDFTQLDLNRKIKTGLGISLFVLLLSSIISFYSIRMLIDRAWWVDHTNQVIINLESIFSTMKDAEAGQRAYLLTGDKDYLISYTPAFDRSFRLFEKIKLLTKDNKGQQESLDSLKPLMQQRFLRLIHVVNLYEQKKFVSERDLQEGNLTMIKIREILVRMREREYSLLASRTKEADYYSIASQIVIVISSLTALIISVVALFFITKDINNKELVQQELARLNEDLEKSNKEILASGNQLKRNNFLLEGNTRLNDLLRGEKDLQVCGLKILTQICEFTKARAGVLYLLDDDGAFHLQNSYAFEIDERVPKSFRIGEGLIGQSALQKKTLRIEDVENSHLRIQSGLSSIAPADILIVPFFYNEHTVAIAELISKEKFEELDIEFLNDIGNTVSIFITSIKSEMKTIELLNETQNQAEELEAQQEELRSMNDDLREQRDRIQASEEELRASEEELQEKNSELEMQYESIHTKNRELEDAKQMVQLKMEQVETVSKYKSEFLANMSHELRTPLNSILILATILKDNHQKRLSEKEVEHASIIEKAGNDLLKLINEILDLSRIESGGVKLEIDGYAIKELQFENQFNELAREKHIDFTVVIKNTAPEKVYTDRFRLEQIMKNLLSNAFKFTPEYGKVELMMDSASTEVRFANESLRGKKVLAISVKDSGIGISKDKLAIVFEAFQQADPSTTRKYGGSGLGLTISRDLAQLLGGEITVQSEVGVGSTFTLYLPEKFEEVKKENALPAASAEAQSVPSGNPIYSILPHTREGAKSILIVEDDFYFSKTVAEYAKGKGYQVYVANAGHEGWELAKKYKPDAILLDVQLPDLNGWDLLKRIKSDTELQGIAVHMMSAYDKDGVDVQLGQENFISKPMTLEVIDRAFADISRNREEFVKKILIIEDNEVENNAIKELLARQEIVADSVHNGKEGLEMSRHGEYDCVVLDINLPDMDGYTVLKQLKTTQETKDLPVIIYSGKDLSEEEENKFNQYADTIIIKTEYSYTRLLEEVKLFMHSISSNISDSIKRKVQKSEALLNNKRVLLVDDDMRNIYSLSSVLEDYGMSVIVAYDGRHALEELEANPDTDIVLMDIMMPHMDGIEATKAIRANTQYKDLPIIAVTAKAMPEDKEKCLAAGVSDYIAKPIDVNKLLSLMRVWIYKS